MNLYFIFVYCILQYTFIFSYKERVNSTKSRQTKLLSFIVCVCVCVCVHARECVRVYVFVCVDKINIFFCFDEIHGQSDP